MIAERGETPVFAGRAVAALAGDPLVMSKTGKILVVSELAIEYGFTDTDGRIPAGVPSLIEPRSAHA
jgi:dehydrogenase/reductase SDR family protein 1